VDSRDAHRILRANRNPAANSPAAIAACAASDAPPPRPAPGEIEALALQLHDELNLLAEDISRLQGRLAPALSEAEPTDKISSEVFATPRTPLGGSLRSAINWVGAHRQAITDLTFRLEL